MNFFKRNAAKISGVVTGLGVLALPLVSHAALADDIGAIADSVGTTFQTSAVTMLTEVLPYVVTVAIVFLAAKLALRWMKRSAR